MTRVRTVCGLGAALLVLLSPAVAAGGGLGLRQPLRMAAYYPWFPEGWDNLDLSPFTHYQPSLGFYDAADPRIVRRQIDAMLWGRIRAATYSWWGRGDPSDLKFPVHLAAASSTGFRWAIYYEPEGYGDPTVDELRSDLEYIRSQYASSPAYLRIGGRLVVFAYSNAEDSCATAARWAEANSVGAFVVLNVVRGFRACAIQPDLWHTYSADRYEYRLPRDSYSISPGFFLATEPTPRRPRDLLRWRRSIHRMVKSAAPLQFIISFNEWGEGTSVESAREWASPSGYGLYLDALHDIR